MTGTLGVVTGSAVSPIAWAGRPSSLGAIRGVTITTGDLAAAERAWTQFMGYQVVSRGRIARQTAASWGAPALSGRGFVALGPQSGEPTLLRFVEQAIPSGYSPGGKLGWSTTEVTVQNSDQLYDRLKDSPFKVLHPPHQIPTYPYLRAMQAEGPAGERLNLTWISPPQPGIAVAKSFVGRCFIAVQGSPDLPASLKFFNETFGNATGPIRDVPEIPKIELAVVDLADGCKIEVDQYPPHSPQNARVDGGLPPGLAIVTFECSNFERLRSRFIAPPTLTGLDTYRGRRVATLVGYAGELIELIET
jgi:hypothetical protein